MILLLGLVRRVVVPLVVLGLLAVGADRVAARVAAGALASQLQVSGGFDAKPDVTIHGFPFLTQAKDGRYERIDVDAGASERGGVRISSLDAEVRGAQVPLRAALKGEVTDVPVDGLDATAVVTYADLARASRLPGVTIRGARGRVDVTASVTVLGQTVQATASSVVSLSGNAIVVRAQSMSAQGGSALVLRALTGKLDLRVPVGTLPFGLRLTDVVATDAGVRLSASAGATTLRG